MSLTFSSDRRLVTARDSRSSNFLKTFSIESIFGLFLTRVLLTQPGERLDHGRLVVPDGLDGGEVVVEEVDAVALEEAVGPRRLPPRDLDGGVRHAHQAHVSRRARG